MKLKYFLKGFGSGVLFATVILSIALLLQPEHKAELTDGEIMARAKELGMEMASTAPEESSDVHIESETGMTEKSAGQETDIGGENRETPEEPGTEIDTELESIAEAEIASVSTENDKIIIEIAKGLSAESIARILQEADVVDSSAEFNYYMMSQGMSRIIRAGTYEFSRGMSYEDIAEVIRLPQD